MGNAMGYRFLEHTADVQVELDAADFPGLLEAGTEALYALTLRERRNSVGESETVFVTGDSREDILVRWLQELIFLLDTKGFVATAFALEENGSRAVAGVLEGYRCGPDERAEEVKSATYHEIEVRRQEDGFIARVIFDL
jgi:SHS2 domain-containing protein